MPIFEFLSSSQQAGEDAYIQSLIDKGVVTKEDLSNPNVVRELRSVYRKNNPVKRGPESFGEDDGLPVGEIKILKNPAQVYFNAKQQRDRILNATASEGVSNYYSPDDPMVRDMPLSRGVARPSGVAEIVQEDLAPTIQARPNMAERVVAPERRVVAGRYVNVGTPVEAERPTVGIPQIRGIDALTSHMNDVATKMEQANALRKREVAAKQMLEGTRPVDVARENMTEFLVNKERQRAEAMHSRQEDIINDPQFSGRENINAHLKSLGYTPKESRLQKMERLNSSDRAAAAVDEARRNLESKVRLQQAVKEGRLRYNVVEDKPEFNRYERGVRRPDHLNNQSFEYIRKKFGREAMLRAKIRYLEDLGIEGLDEQEKIQQQLHPLDKGTLQSSRREYDNLKQQLSIFDKTKSVVKERKLARDTARQERIAAFRENKRKEYEAQQERDMFERNPEALTAREQSKGLENKALIQANSDRELYKMKMLQRQQQLDMISAFLEQQKVPEDQRGAIIQSFLMGEKQ